MASPLKPQMQCPNNLQFPDSRPRACSHRSLFVRRTPTRPRAKGQEPHFTQRLVRSVRCGSRVRQRTLLNLGRRRARRPVGHAAAPSAAPARGAGPVRSAARRRPRQPRQPHGRAGLRARRRPVRPAAHRHPARPDQHVLREHARTGSRWPAAAIPGRSATTVRRSRFQGLAGNVAEGHAAAILCRRSRVLAGNVAEGGTLQAMPTALDALRERGHRCLVASRERQRVFDESRAVAIGTAGGQRVLACAETDGNGETRPPARPRSGRSRSALGPRPTMAGQRRRATGAATRRRWPGSGSALEGSGATASWTTLRRRLAGQRRVTAVFRQADGRMLHARKATRAESWQRAIHERLGVDASPGGVRKLVVQPRRRRKHARNAVPHA